MHPRYIVFILVLLLHARVATAGPNTASELVIFHPLAAHYQETRRVAGAPLESADWYFTRQDKQVESARADYAEVWQRDDRNELTLTRVFQRDRKLIQYTPGELRTQGRQQDWTTLNSIFDPRQLAMMKQVGTVTFLGRSASRYTGKLNGENIEVLWLSQDAIAAKITRSGKDGSVSLTLKELRTSPDSRWPQANLAKAEQYAFLDGADLGDMEYDPFVQRVLGLDGGHGAHAQPHSH